MMPEGIAIVDWVLLACLLFSTVVGAWRGLLFEVLSLFVWLFAFWAAQWWAPLLVQAYENGQSHQPLFQGIAFVLVFVLAALGGGLVVQFIKKTTDAIGLRPVDRAMGAVFGMLRGIVALLVLTLLIQLTPLASAQAWQVSVGVRWLSALLMNLKPFLPQAFGSYLG